MAPARRTRLAEGLVRTIVAPRDPPGISASPGAKAQGLMRVELLGQRLHHVARAGLVGGAHHVVDVAGAHQGVDVRLVRLRRHRVAQEDHRVDPAFGQARADLQVAAQRAAEQAFHLEAGLGDQARAGGAGGHHVAAGEERREVTRERDHQVFLGVVRDQGDVHRAIISTAVTASLNRMPQSEGHGSLRIAHSAGPHRCAQNGKA
jgi:hypothetical protein